MNRSTVLNCVEVCSIKRIASFSLTVNQIYIHYNILHNFFLLVYIGTEHTH